MANRLCQALGIEYPVIQGAMAWTSMAPLVAAVSEAGGLGVLGSGFMPKEIILGQVEAVRKMTGKPFAANLFLDPGPQLETGTQAILEGQVPVVYIDSLNLLEYGAAKECYDRFHAAGCKVIAKGVEGGGHCTKVSGRVLLAEVTGAVSIPVVASGGIATPRQAAACTVMGADGVEMGTAFMASEECPVHINVKKAVVSATDRDIVACGASTGEPSWQIRNRLADRLLQIEREHPWSEAAGLIREASAGSLRIASLDGEVEEQGAVMSGQAAGLIHEIQPVKALVAGFCERWQGWLNRRYTLY